MRPAVIYSRVSGRDQEREGYSIPAQQKSLRDYAQTHDLEVLREFVDVETAKSSGRKQFGEMIRFFKENPACRIVLAEKTDRLYRNFRDYILLEDLEIEIHLPKEGLIISKEAKSQTKLVHGIQVVIARNYIENLREEVRKGMREKAEQGIYPSRPPLGYRNNKVERTIEIDPDKAPIAQRLFELYASGKYSLLTLGNALRAEFGGVYPKGYLERLLKNPFYIGLFLWEGKTYAGNHLPLVSRAVYDRVQEVLRGRNRPKSGKREFAFSGLLQCAYDHCAVTAEMKKSKYVYYHCTGYRGKCQLPYFREEEIGDRLGEILKNIHIPDDILVQLEHSLRSDQDREQVIRRQQIDRLQQRLTTVRRRLDQAYLDKLDGRITEEFWERKSADWHEEEQHLLMSIRELDAGKPDRLLDGVRILELANKAHFLYLRQTAAEKAKLLRMVLSNCAIDAASLYPTYRKPFDLILQAAQTGRWWAWGDSNSRHAERDSVKKWLKSGQDSLPDEVKNVLKYDNNISIADRRILERYKHFALSVHVHGIGFIVPEDFCAVCHFGTGNLNHHSPSIQVHRLGEHGRDGQKSVLIDVCEFRKNPEGMQVAVPLPIVVGLQTINDCLRTCGHPVQSLTADLLPKRLGGIADREGSVLRRSLTVHEHKLPHDIVKRRSHVVKIVSDDRACLQSGTRDMECENSAAVRVILGTNPKFSISMGLESFGYRIQVLLCPDEFEANAIQGIGHKRKIIAPVS